MGAQRQRRWTSQPKKRENPPSPLLSFCLGPQQIKWCLPTLLRMVFTQATASNANISESFTEALRNHVLPGVWAFLIPVKLIHKINHLRIQKVLKSYRNQIPHGSLWFSLLSLFCVLGWKVRLLIWCVCVCAHSIMSDSMWPQGLLPTRLLCPWNFPGKNTWAGWHFLLQGIFLTQGVSPPLLCLLHWQEDSLPLHHLGSPWIDFFFLNIGV